MEMFYTPLFGLLATAVMTVLLYAISNSGNEGMAFVRGIGSAVPTQAGGSLTPGVVVHVLAGLVFAYLYAALGRQFAFEMPGQMLALGVVVGLLRGGAVSLVLAMLAYDQQPLEHIARAGRGVAGVHALGNVAYGLVVSLLFGLSSVEYALSYT